MVNRDRVVDCKVLFARVMRREGKSRGGVEGSPLEEGSNFDREKKRPAYTEYTEKRIGRINAIEK